MGDGNGAGACVGGRERWALLQRSGFGGAELGAVGRGVGEGGFPGSCQRGVVEEGVGQPPAGSALLKPGSAGRRLLGLHQLDA